MDWSIHQGDCLVVLPILPDSSIDLVVTDPLYYRVKAESWDRQWASAEDYLAWLDRVLIELRRVLRPNGSLYLFATPDMGARVECLVAQSFTVLNHLVWAKKGSKANQAEKEALRSYFPSSERIIFAEQIGADAIAKGQAGYEAKCDEARGLVFEPIRAYLDEERKRCGLTSAQIQDGMAELTGARYTFEKHSFSRSQWEMPTREQYEAARALFNRQPGGEFLRREYEELRRPFALSAAVPFTDVWACFDSVPHHRGKHICEKPLPLLRHLIAASSKPGAVVLDAFAGSGSTGDAALSLGRQCVLIEQDPKWCERARRRLGQGRLAIGEADACANMGDRCPKPKDAKK